MENLSQLAETIASYAAERGLVVCREHVILDVDHSPTTLFDR